MMRKNEILAASDRQLNEWAAAKVLGLEVSEWYDAVTVSDKPMMKIDSSDRVIVSEPFLFGTMTEYSHQWHLYNPATDIAQAIGLLDHLREQGFYHSLYSNINRDHKVHVGKQGKWGYCSGFCEDASRSRAIVVACLLALADVEELEASIAGMDEQQAVTP